MGPSRRLQRPASHCIERFATNAEALARAAVLFATDRFHNAFISDDDHTTIWTEHELRKRCNLGSWEGQVAYVIEFYRNDRRMGVKPWPGDLATAKDHALNYMPVHNATHVTEIDDETKQIIFSYRGGGNEQGT